MRRDSTLKLTLALVLLACVFLVTRGGFVSADTVDEAKTMQSLLERLERRILEDGEFSVTFEFHSPLIKGDDVWWSVPYFNEEFELTRDLGEIGADYVCFHERW